MAGNRLKFSIPLFAVVCAGGAMLANQEAQAETRVCSNTYCGGWYMCFYVSNADCNFDETGEKCTVTKCQKS